MRLLILLVLLSGCTDSEIASRCFKDGLTLHHWVDTEPPLDLDLCAQDRGNGWYWQKSVGRFQADKCTCLQRTIGVIDDHSNVD